MNFEEQIVKAAAELAKELHAGQVDKGGKDYFTAHLERVALSCDNWMQTVVGYLHDAAEDCGISEDEVIERLSSAVTDTCCADMLDIKAALVALNHNYHAERSAYIDNIKRNHLALDVKLKDLECNMDLTRIPNPTQKDFDRLERYKKEYAELKSKKSSLNKTC